jgi:hypothetical protein
MNWSYIVWWCLDATYETREYVADPWVMSWWTRARGWKLSWSSSVSMVSLPLGAIFPFKGVVNCLESTHLQVFRWQLCSCEQRWQRLLLFLGGGLEASFRRFWVVLHFVRVLWLANRKSSITTDILLVLTEVWMVLLIYCYFSLIHEILWCFGYMFLSMCHFCNFLSHALL